MADHDPLCEVDVHGNFCQCALIAKVRADEREQAATRMYLQREHLRADLRAKVEALPILLVDTRFDPESVPIYTRAVALADILALIDGDDARRE